MSVDNPLDLNLIRLFVTLVESRTLTEAARRLGMTRSNVSRRLKTLELNMGAQLLLRTTRHVEFTQAGQLLYQHGARVLEEIETARTSIDSLHAGVRGDVRVRLPTGLGHIYLAPLLLQFASRHPEINLRVLINDYIGDLVSAEVDLALKITSDPPADHVARRLCDIAWCLCASPVFLAGRQGIGDIRELADCPLIAPASMGRRFDLKLNAGGTPVLLRVAPRLQSGDYPFMVEAALAGLGVALLPRYAVWRQLQSGALCEVLPQHEPDGVGNGLYLLTAPNRFPTMAARTLLDFVREHIRLHQGDWERPSRLLASDLPACRPVPQEPVTRQAAPGETASVDLTR